jgi:tyrosinase
MTSLIVRKNADNLDPTELQALRTGYSKAQAILDNRSYNHFAGLHGIPNWFCWHHDHVQGSAINANLFLPWHRAYLLFFERAIRDQSPAAPKVGLPWWDWTSAASHATGVPAAFSTATAGGKANPLFRARIVAPTATPPINRVTRRFPGDPAQLPTAASIQNLLNLGQFNDFSTQLEDIHDAVHGWTGGNNGVVGGDMGSLSTAAWDPIFWSHHCMIDRLWYLWQMKHGVNSITPSLLPLVLRPFSMTVQDVLSVNALGYEYAVSLVTI